MLSTLRYEAACVSPPINKKSCVLAIEAVMISRIFKTCGARQTIYNMTLAPRLQMAHAQSQKDSLAHGWNVYLQSPHTRIVEASLDDVSSEVLQMHVQLITWV